MSGLKNGLTLIPLRQLWSQQEQVLPQSKRWNRPIFASWYFLWNAIMKMVEVFVTKSNHILAEKTRSKRSRLSLSLAPKPTEVGGSCVVWSPYITSVPHQGCIVLVKINSSCYIKSIWIFYEHITSVPHTFVPCFSGAFWGFMILTRNRQIVTKQPLLLSVCTSTNFAALPSILKYPRIWGSWNPKSLDSISQSCSGLAM